ncbi:MAG: hypothetical protein Fur0022_14600 [Anaerolineales bacterium]
MDFGEVLSKAWQITWKYKVLWIFGILAGCGGQAGNNFNFQGNGSGSGPGSSGGPGNFPLPAGLQQLLNAVERWLNGLSDIEAALLIGGMMLVVLTLAAISIVLSTIGRIGLVQGTLEGDRGIASLSFGDLMGRVRPYFWRVLGLNLVLAGMIILIVIVFAAIIIFSTAATLGLGVLCIIPLLCLLVPLGWIVGIITEQAYIALMVDNLGIMDALHRGWQLFRENIGNMLLMGLILGIGGLIVGYIVALPFLLIVMPVVFGFITGTAKAVQSGLLIAGLCFVVYLPVLLILSGMVQTYIASAWTLTYLRLSRPRQIAMEAA